MPGKGPRIPCTRDKLRLGQATIEPRRDFRPLTVDVLPSECSPLRRRTDAKGYMSQAELDATTAPRSAARARDDAALLRRVAQADHRAFEALYRGYFPRLRRFLERVTRRMHLVEEILDDTMLVVWQKASTFNGQSLVSTWIFAIAYRKAMKALQRLDEPMGEIDDGVADDSEPDAALMHAELRELLVEAIGRMTPAHRAVIELTYYQGCAYSEIATIMDCPVDTVKTRMFHARRRLRHLIGERREDLL